MAVVELAELLPLGAREDARALLVVQGNGGMQVLAVYVDNPCAVQAHIFVNICTTRRTCNGH